jgi:hypothetical protein
MKDLSKITFKTKADWNKPKDPDVKYTPPRPRYKQKIGSVDAKNGVTVTEHGHIIFIDGKGVETIKLKITPKSKK